MTGSPFWQFSLAFYRQAKVADACIALQDAAGVDVNLMLFLLWQARQGRTVSAGEVASLEARVGPWRDMTVIPLRSVRRALKVPQGLVAPPEAEAFRTRIKAVELEAERLQQEAMAALPPPGQAGADPVRAASANVAAYAEMLGVRFPEAAVATLLAALPATTLPGQ